MAPGPDRPYHEYFSMGYYPRLCQRLTLPHLASVLIHHGVCDVPSAGGPLRMRAFDAERGAHGRAPPAPSRLSGAKASRHLARLELHTRDMLNNSTYLLLLHLTCTRDLPKVNQ